MRPTRREFLWTAGAVTAGAFAFQQTRDVFWAPEGDPDLGWAPELEEFRTSTCLVCPARCGLRGRIVDGRLVRLTGNARHPMSRGGVCPRGIAGVQLAYHPERLSGPLVRDGDRGSGRWRTVSRDDAIAQIADRLRGLRDGGHPEQLALLTGYCAGSMHDLWSRFFEVYGSPHHVVDAYPDGTEAVMDLMHGIARRPAYDLEHSRLVLSFGAPLFEAWWSPLQAFVAYGHPNGEGERPRFVQVDTRFSRTAARAQDWVGIRPGTHAALALGIAYVLIRDGLVDQEFLARHVTGFADFTVRGRRRQGYRSLVMSNYRTEEVSQITGVPVERITALAQQFARSRPALAVLGPDVMLASHGLLAGMAVHSLNVLTGSIARPGGVRFASPPPLQPLPTAVHDEVGRVGRAREPVFGTPPRFSDGDVAGRFADAVAAASNQPIDTLILYYANPLASASRADTWRRALDRIPFIVSFSPFLDETTRLADVVLPDLLPYERWQDGPTPTSYPYPVWGVARPLVAPHAGGTHTGSVVLTIAQQLGGGLAQSLPYADFESVLKARARGLFSARRGTTFGNDFERSHHRQMEERGWWLAEHNTFDTFWDSMVERGGWMDLFYDERDPANIARTRSGRIELMPQRLIDALEELGRPGSVYSSVAELRPVETPEYPLRLIPYRLSTLSSGTLTCERWLAEQPAIFPDVQWTPWVEMSPHTASERGLSNGSTVWVVSPRGRLRARLVVFPGTAPGTVCVPYGPRHPDGDLANPLQLIDGSGDPLTGLSAWFETFVRVEAA